MAIPTALFRMAAGLLGEAAVVEEESVLLTLLAERLGGIYNVGTQEITIPVSSTAIAEIGYEVGTGTITVVFHRGGSLSYTFPGSEAEFAAFALSPSKGQFFNAHFRDR